MTHRLLYNPQLHTSQTFLALLEAVLRDPARLPTFDFAPSAVSAAPPQFTPSPEELARVKEKLRQETGGTPRSFY